MAITNKTINNYLEKVITLRAQIAELERDLKPLETAVKKALSERCLESYYHNGHGYKLVSTARKSYDYDLIMSECPQAVSINTTTCYRYK